MFRQGDVLILPIRVFPPQAKELDKDGGRIILARGEATGHAHAILEPDARLFKGPGGRYLRVPENGALLLHEEHAPIPLPQGDYKIVLQREYDPEKDRVVAD